MTFRSHLLRTVRGLYWSRLGGPLRALRGTAVPPPNDAAFWDAQVKGFFAPRLGGTFSVDARNNLIAMLVKYELPTAQSALDFGCAGGTLAPVLLSRGFSRYVGIDISQHAIAHAREHIADPRATFEVGVVEQYSGSSPVDLIVLSEVLYYLDFATVGETVLRLVKHLSPNGLLCVSLNLHPKSQAIQRVLRASPLDYVRGVLYQEKTGMDTRTRPNAERPPYHTFLLRPRRNETPNHRLG